MDSQAADKRKQILDEAVSALALTKSALAALDSKDTASALATLPVLRAKLLLKRAEPLVEDGQRSEASYERLETLLNEARQQLEMAELLSYGKRKDFESMHAELKQVKEKTGGGGGGKGWFDDIKAELSKLF